MMKLLTPKKAIRMIPANGRENYSPWHLQKPTKMNKTICGIIIASGRGYKYRSKAFWTYYRKAKKFWEGKKISAIKKGAFCKTCLGVLTLES